MAFKTGLEFAPGTTEDCQRLVAKLFSPNEILGAYREARTKFKNGDLVLVVSERDASGFEAMPRLEYVKRIRQALGPKAPLMPALTIAHKSAHAVMKLPFEDDAIWLVILREQQIPSMCVIFTTPYEVTANAN